MSTIFGSNGDLFNRFGNQTFFNKAGGGSDNIFHVGNTSYSGSAGPMYNVGGMSSFGGGHIFRSGNTYNCNGQQYYRSGNTLYGPNGQSWYGSDMSDEDIRDIISHNC